MGLPIKITCTTNVNDTVHRAITDGEYFPKGNPIITIAPAMDIQVCKLEFLLYLFIYSLPGDCSIQIKSHCTRIG